MCLALLLRFLLSMEEGKFYRRISGKVHIVYTLETGLSRTNLQHRATRSQLLFSELKLYKHRSFV